MNTLASSRLTPGRSLALALCAALFAGAGWLAGTGIDRAAPGGLFTWYTPVGAVLWLAAGWAAVLLSTGDLSESRRGLLPFETVPLGGAAFALLGWSAADGTLHLWALAVALLTGLLGALLTVRGARLRRRDVAAYRHRREHGVSVPGVVLDLERAGTADDDRPVLTLTVRYTAADGAEYIERVSQDFPAYDLPRRGETVTVRHLPEDPRSIDLRAPGPWATV